MSLFQCDFFIEWEFLYLWIVMKMPKIDWKKEETSKIILNCTLALSWTDFNVCKSLLESISDNDSLMRGF